MSVENLIGELPIGWKLTTLGQVAKSGGGGIQTGPFGSQLHASDYVEHGTPSIMPRNIGDNRVIIDGIARITQEDAVRLDRYRVVPGDIVYSRRGDVEKRALIREEESGWLCGTGCLRVRFGDETVDPTFASYYLGHPNVREWVVRHAHGATMPNLNTSILSSLPFIVPPVYEQRRIAHILGTLDDKIELNRKMNETLEEIARTLFTSWFVNFDPVRAKAEGREPFGMDAETAALFPDSFVDSELGPNPSGWDVSTLGEAATIVGGSTPSTKAPHYWGGETFFTTPRDMSKLDVPIMLSSERTITSEGVDAISSGKLPVGTVLMSSRAPIGYLAIAYSETAINQGIIGCICGKEVPNTYLINWLQANMDTIIGHANGTTFLEISKRNFRPVKFVRPDNRVLSKFTEAVAPMYDLIASNAMQSRVLADVRDTLLPKLLSGELRVPEAERIAEEVAL